MLSPAPDVKVLSEDVTQQIFSKLNKYLLTKCHKLWVSLSTDISVSNPACPSELQVRTANFLPAAQPAALCRPQYVSMALFVTFLGDLALFQHYLTWYLEPVTLFGSQEAPTPLPPSRSPPLCKTLDHVLFFGNLLNISQIPFSSSQVTAQPGRHDLSFRLWHQPPPQASCCLPQFIFCAQPGRSFQNTRETNESLALQA